MIQTINISEKFDLVTEHFRPKTVAELNGQTFQLAKIKGDYPWHAHPNEDEMFFCWKGVFTLDVERPRSVWGTEKSEVPESPAISDGTEPKDFYSVVVGEGECIVVPKGTRHRPRAEEECWIFLIEPVGTKNSGETVVDAKYDAPVGAWV